MLHRHLPFMHFPLWLQLSLQDSTWHLWPVHPGLQLQMPLLQMPRSEQLSSQSRVAQSMPEKS